MVNDIIQEQQPTCALFFVSPPTCEALSDCVEPAVWCWHESCPYPTPSEPCLVNETTVYYCSCSQIPPSLMVATTTDYLLQYTPAAKQTNNNGMPTGALAAIVVISLLIAAALLVLLVWIIIKYRRRRKLEGRYCPAVEEEKSAVKNLPPLPPPSIEGLI